MSRTIRNALLGAVAVAAMAPMAAAAKEGDVAKDVFVPQMAEDSHLASELIGSYVYASAEPDAETLGDVNNLVVGADGDVKAVVIGVGGFLGVAEKNVAVDMSKLMFVTGGEGQERLVLSTSKETLEAAPEYTLSDGDAYTIDSIYGAAGGEQRSASAEASKADQLPTIDPSEISAEKLVNMRVYTMRDDDWVGEVGDVVLTDDGEIDAVVIDFGGFLGIGEKDVAVAFDSLTFKDDGDNDGDFYVYTNLTREELEAAPTYEAETYQAQRDTMRVGQKS